MDAPGPEFSEPLRAPDPRRILCAVCEHTEFVHGDLDRSCLYSECDCSAFTLSAVA